jgi:hypothetical protein
VIIIMPPPERRNEAYLVAAVRQQTDACRTFFLERAVMPSTGEEFTMVGELAAKGRYNWGPGTDPIPEAFAELVTRIVSDPSIRPLAFVPLQS